MKKSLFTLLLLFMGVSYLVAQRSISGKVSDNNGTSLIGATVLITGTSSGTVTDENGNFALTVPNDATSLTVSFTGYVSQNVLLSADSYYNITIAEDVKQLNEVVVTALGIERNSREVVYANQIVRSDDLLSTPNKNTLQALRGKAAGVRISTGSGSVGASSRIVLRGEGSLTGDNNALIVVNGVPLDNSATSGGSGTAQDGYSDYGNRFNDINPEDIESVTILKGPSATSLYGSRGASGVILVTTKSGGEGKEKIKVGINSSYSFQDAYVILKRQDKFGQGADNSVFDSGENWSWGPAFDGKVRPWTSPIDVDGDGALEALTRPYSAVPNQVENFFNRGQILNNNIYFSGAKGGFTYYASYANISQKGILDNTKYDRNSLNFRATAKLTKRLSTEFGINYSNINLNTAQEGYRPFEGQNAYANVIQTPVNIPISELRDYNNPFYGFKGYYGSYSTNPYFILNEYKNDGSINNFLGDFKLTYNVFKNFNLIGSLGLNYVNELIETGTPVYAYEPQLIWNNDLVLSFRDRSGSQSSIGDYSRNMSKSTNLNGSILGNYNTNIGEQFTLDVTAGTNLFDRRSAGVSGATIGGLVVPGWFHLKNSVQSPSSDQFNTKYRLVGLLGNAKIGFQNRLFLEYSARNDWSSTLPKENNSFFYQAVGLSAVLTDMFLQDNDKLSYLKARASVGTTGKDAGLYLLQSTYIGNPVIQSLNNHDLITPFNGQPGFRISNLIGNPNLRPELTTTYEAGLDIGLFKNRINIEYTFYHSIHSDQIIQVSLPSSTGFTSTYGNIGEMTNTGHEIGLNLKPIAGLSRNVKWDLFLTFATNKNNVTKVSEQQDEIVVGGPYTNGAISVVAKEGLPYGTFRSTVPETTPDGKVVVDASGIPVLTLDEHYLGSYQPKYTASIGSNVGFYGFTFNFLIDIKKGGKFLSITKNQSEFNGTSLSTVVHNRDSFVIANSVIKNADGTYSPNTTKVNEQELYAVSDVYFGGSSLLIDASYIKLRELGLSYDLTRLFSQNTKKWISGANLGVFATNLKFWLPEENVYADPEVNGPSLIGNATGIETTQIPPSKSYGVRLSLTF